MLGGLGTTELIIILVIVLVIFGAGKLPEVGGALGKGIRNFRRAAKGEDDIDVTPTASARAQQESLDKGPVDEQAPASEKASTEV